MMLMMRLWRLMMRRHLEGWSAWSRCLIGSSCMLVALNMALTPCAPVHTMALTSVSVGEVTV